MKITENGGKVKVGAWIPACAGVTETGKKNTAKAEKAGFYAQPCQNPRFLLNLTYHSFLA
jgi:hypothetical protein